jgi:hypothetical protein
LITIGNGQLASHGQQSLGDRHRLRLADRIHPEGSAGSVDKTTWPMAAPAAAAAGPQ